MTKEIFVFGSNLAGRHGKGAALFAKLNHGAVYRQGVGIQGNSYAIPTKDSKLAMLSLGVISMYVTTFLSVARFTPNNIYNVTAIGCGLAGYKPSQIAPMFRDAPENCRLPKEFTDILKTPTLTITLIP